VPAKLTELEHERLITGLALVAILRRRLLSMSARSNELCPAAPLALRAVLVSVC